jgi:hypothetical protein
MPISIPKDFRLKLPSGEVFSSLNENTLFLETDSKIKCKSAIPPLRMINHAKLIFDIMNLTNTTATWLVEAATDDAKERLCAVMPNVSVFGTSLVGHFEPSLDIIKRFWNIHSELDESEPWNYELPWAIFCVKVQPVLLNPKAVILGSFFQNWAQTYGVFVQSGWFGFLGVKRIESSIKRVADEFSELLIDS